MEVDAMPALTLQAYHFLQMLFSGSVIASCLWLDARFSSFSLGAGINF